MKRDKNGYFICDWCGFSTNHTIPEPSTMYPEPTSRYMKTIELMAAIKCNDCIESDKTNPLNEKENKIDMQHKIYSNMAELVKNNEA
jgi:hypothetical protein